MQLDAQVCRKESIFPIKEPYIPCKRALYPPSLLQLDAQEAASRGTRTELERCKAELELASAEVVRLEGEVERGRNREAQLQADAVLLNQKHQQVPKP